MSTTYSHRARFFLIYLAAALISVSFFNKPALGDTEEKITKVPVLINVLEGVTISDENIEAMIDKANEILKQANIEIEAKSSNTTRDVNDQGNHDGRLSRKNKKALDRNGLKEANEKLGKGKGIKIYITNQIGSGRCDGLTSHASNNNSSVTPPRTIYIKAEPNDLNNDPNKLGNVCAHEHCHSLTLGPGHIEKAGTYADRWGHSRNPNNLMYPSYLYKAGNKIRKRGKKLNEEQKKEIKKGAKCLGHTKLVQHIAKPYPFGEDPNVLCLDTIHGGWVDDINETANVYTDLFTGSLFAEDINGTLELNILLNGTFPTSPVDINVAVYFNTDANGLTGSNFGPATGVDKAINIELSGNHPAGDFDATVVDINSGSTTYLHDGHTATIVEIYDFPDDNDTPYTEDYIDGLNQTLPMSMILPLADQVPVWIRLDDNSSSDYDEVNFQWQITSPNPPTLELTTTRLEPGQKIFLTGQNFTPSSQVEIFLDDDLLDTITAEPNGAIDANMPLPVVDFNDFFVTARDVSGAFDFSLLEVTHNIADLTYNQEVDFLDFSVFADNWLVGVNP